MRQVEKRVGFRLSRLPVVVIVVVAVHWIISLRLEKCLSETVAPRVTRHKTELHTRKAVKGCVILLVLSRG